MTKLLLPLLSLSFLACQPNEPVYTDVAARAAGRYVVQSYVINGDTLYSSRGINKIGISEFYVIVDRKNPDSVRVGSVYKKTGDAGSVTSIKDVGVSEINGAFQLSARPTATSIYESRITANSFYERTAKGGFGIIIIPPGYSIKTPIDPTLEGVIISAQK
jgi:hypothetical protein